MKMQQSAISGQQSAKIKLKWRRVWSRLLGIDLRSAEYGEFKILLEKRTKEYRGKRWLLRIFAKDMIRVVAGYPNLMIAQAKAEEYLRTDRVV